MSNGVSGKAQAGPIGGEGFCWPSKVPCRCCDRVIRSPGAPMKQTMQPPPFRMGSKDGRDVYWRPIQVTSASGDEDQRWDGGTGCCAASGLAMGSDHPLVGGSAKA